MSDNGTAIALINNMCGSRSIPCHQIAKQIWEWAKMQGVCPSGLFKISAAHIPGQKNIEADKKSRKFKYTTEWVLSKEAFSFISKQFAQTDMDLFGTRANKKINKYISWKLDADSIAMDAFLVTLGKHFNYCFPPFSLIWKVLTQTVLKLIVATSIVIGSSLYN